MKQIFLFILLMTFVGIGFGQPKLPNGAIVEKYSLSGFDTISISQNTYNTDSTLQSEVWHSYPSLNNSSMTSYTYNSKKLISEQKEFNWNQSNNSWSLRYKVNRSYNGLDLLESIYAENYTSSGTFYNLDSQFYDTGGLLVLVKKFFGSPAALTSEIRHVYNSLGKRINSYELDWDAGSNSFDTVSLRFYESDISALTDSTFFQYRDTTKWVTRVKYYETFDSTGNVIKSESLYFDFQGGVWLGDTRYHYTFHPDNSRNQILHESNPYPPDPYFVKIRTTFLYESWNGQLEVTHSRHFNIYPNPSNGEIFLDIKGFPDVVLLEVKNIEGKTVIFKNLSAVSVQRIELSGPAGIYFFHFSNGREIVQKKVVKY